MTPDVLFRLAVKVREFRSIADDLGKALPRLRSLSNLHGEVLMDLLSTNDMFRGLLHDWTERQPLVRYVPIKKEKKRGRKKRK